MEQEYLRETIISALDTLTPKEREVLLYRYPLNGDDKLILKDIANIYGITTTRVGQLEKNALDKLRKNYKIRQLVKEYAPELVD